MTAGSRTIDQKVLRECIGLASSYLVTDTNMNSASGATSWYRGFSRLIDVVVALHARDELECETMNFASKACSECWSVAGEWREFIGCREGVRSVAIKLKNLLDPNERTYKGMYVVCISEACSTHELVVGENVYAP